MKRYYVKVMKLSLIIWAKLIQAKFMRLTVMTFQLSTDAKT